MKALGKVLRNPVVKVVINVLTHDKVVVGAERTIAFTVAIAIARALGLIP